MIDESEDQIDEWDPLDGFIAPGRRAIAYVKALRHFALESPLPADQVVKRLAARIEPRGNPFAGGDAPFQGEMYGDEFCLKPNTPLTKGIAPELAGRIESLDSGGCVVRGRVQLSTGTLAVLMLCVGGVLPLVTPRSIYSLGSIELPGWLVSLPAGLVLAALSIMFLDFLPQARAARDLMAELAESPTRSD